MNIKNKSVALFNRDRAEARPSPTVVSNTIPTLPKPSQIKTESIEEFRRRSGEVTLCKPKLAPKRGRTQSKPTRGQMLSVVRSNPPKTTSTPNIVEMCCIEALRPVILISISWDDELEAAA